MPKENGKPKDLEKNNVEQSEKEAGKNSAKRTYEVVKAEYDKVCARKRELAEELHNLKEK